MSDSFITEKLTTILNPFATSNVRNQALNYINPFATEDVKKKITDNLSNYVKTYVSKGIDEFVDSSKEKALAFLAKKDHLFGKGDTFPANALNYQVTDSIWSPLIKLSMIDETSIESLFDDNQGNTELFKELWDSIIKYYNKLDNHTLNILLICIPKEILESNSLYLIAKKIYNPMTTSFYKPSLSQYAYSKTTVHEVKAKKNDQNSVSQQIEYISWVYNNLTNNQASRVIMGSLSIAELFRILRISDFFDEHNSLDQILFLIMIKKDVLSYCSVIYHGNLGAMIALPVISVINPFKNSSISCRNLGSLETSGDIEISKNQWSNLICSHITPYLMFYKQTLFLDYSFNSGNCESLSLLWRNRPFNNLAKYSLRQTIDILIANREYVELYNLCYMVLYGLSCLLEYVVFLDDYDSLESIKVIELPRRYKITLNNIEYISKYYPIISGFDNCQVKSSYYSSMKTKLKMKTDKSIFVNEKCRDYVETMDTISKGINPYAQISDYVNAETAIAAIVETDDLDKIRNLNIIMDTEETDLFMVDLPILDSKVDEFTKALSKKYGVIKNSVIQAASNTYITLQEAMLSVIPDNTSIAKIDINSMIAKFASINPNFNLIQIGSSILIFMYLVKLKLSMDDDEVESIGEFTINRNNSNFNKYLDIQARQIESCKLKQEVFF